MRLHSNFGREDGRPGWRDGLDAPTLVQIALADPTRRAILARLATGEASVGELAEPFEISQPAVSKHLKVLERAGLVSVEQDGPRRLRHLETAPLDAATDWIARYRDLWESQFRRLDVVLDELEAARRSD